MKTKKAKSQPEPQKVFMTVGLAKFDNSLASKIRSFITANKRKFQLQNMNWRIIRGFYDQDKWNEVFPLIIEAECQSLWLYQNFSPRVLKDIAIPYFLKLKTLSLSQNAIESIQTLAFLNMDNLQKLILRKNLITNTRPFQKCRWNLFLHLCLTKNPTTSIELNRMKLGTNDKKRQDKLELEADNMFGGKLSGGANIFAKLDFIDVTWLSETKKDGKFMLPKFAKRKNIKFTVSIQNDIG